MLLAGPDGADWVNAATRLDVRVTGYLVGVHLRDVTGTWCPRYGVGPAGAVLIRPDGHVAWRSPGGPTDAPRELAEVLGLILAIRGSGSGASVSVDPGLPRHGDGCREAAWDDS